MLLQCPCQLARYWRNWDAADLMECIYASLCFATFSTLFGSRSSIKQVRCLQTSSYIHVNVLSSCRLRIFWRLPRLLPCCCQSTDTGTGMKGPPDSGVWAPWPWVKDKCLSRNWSSWKNSLFLPDKWFVASHFSCSFGLIYIIYIQLYIYTIYI